MMKRMMVVMVTVMAALAITFGAAQAADGWQVSVSPYSWAVGMKGDVGTERTGTFAVDMDFGDVADVFKGGLALAAEVRKDNRWIFLVDGQYLGMEQEKARGRAGVEVDLDGYILGGFAGYRLGDKVTVDLLVGGRYVEQQLEVDFANLESRSQTKAWADALGGARLIVPFNDHFGVSVFGAIGGGDSDFTWEVLPAAYWNINPHVAVKAGYRIMDYDFSKDDFIYDVRTEGVIAGVTVTF